MSFFKYNTEQIQYLGHNNSQFITLSLKKNQMLERYIYTNKIFWNKNKWWQENIFKWSEYKFNFINSINILYI